MTLRKAISLTEYRWYRVRKAQFQKGPYQKGPLYGGTERPTFEYQKGPFFISYRKGPHIGFLWNKYKWVILRPRQSFI